MSCPLYCEVPLVVLGHEAVARVRVVLDEEGRQPQRLVVVQPVAAVALAALDRAVAGRAVRADAEVHEVGFALSASSP